VRLQANQVVGNIKFNRLMEPFENMVLPLLWVDLTIDNLPVTLQMLVHGIKYIFPLLQGIIMLFLLLAGFYQLSSAFILCFWSPATGVLHKSEQEEKRASILPGLTLGASFHNTQESMQHEIQKLLPLDAHSNKLSEV